MSYEIEIRCSYCGEYLGVKHTERVTSFALMMEAQGLPMVSHGICQRCRQYALQDIMSYNDEGCSNESK
ncbi:MAG: hypothetical protein HQK63_16990 [Desulfamplus sp.]|nr:hypothetical protein [Desulfamplus sp.]